ncbi:MAG: hypothetical protein AABZ33_02240 [Chloroflexota bacterium]
MPDRAPDEPDDVERDPVVDDDPIRADAGPGRLRTLFRRGTSRGRVTPVDPDGISGGDRSRIGELAAAELAALPLGGLTRRRIASVAGALLGAWILVAFVGQVGDAATITARADEMRAANTRLVAQLAAAEQELQRIQDTEYVSLQARAYRLGEANEIPFALAADPPALGPDAPGSAATRVGAEAFQTTPLESWLSLLFGPVR